jgi:hypothetical protein
MHLFFLFFRFPIVRRSPSLYPFKNISHVENGKPIKIKFVTESGEGKSFTKKIRVSKKSD